MKIERVVTVEVEPTVGEIADAIWYMTAEDKVALLSSIDNRFFIIPAEGEEQLAGMYRALRKQSLESKNVLSI